MSIPNLVHLLSNGSIKTFPNNKLTEFRNSIPNVINFKNNENIQVSLEAIGFSCGFRNISVPENELPSVVVTNSGYQKSNCLESNICDLWRSKRCMDSLKFDFNNIGRREILKEYHLEDRWYTAANVKEMVDKNNEDDLLRWDFNDDHILSISNNPLVDYWILIHPTFMESFNISSFVESEDWIKKRTGKQKENPFAEAFGSYFFNYKIYESIFQRMVTYKEQLYYGFYLNINAYQLVGTKCANLSDSKIPDLIKVQSSILTSQILNNTHSKDLICFCPDFNTITTNFYYKEFEQPQRIKLQNTTLTNIDITLVDENNRKLQLLPGVPTLIKLKFEKMPDSNKSYNVRLTSNKNELYPNNNNSVFKVRLPKTLFFNREKNWKVALTSISHPNKFSTFAGEVNDRIMLYKPQGDEPVQKLLFDDEKVYTKEEIVLKINELLKNFGVCELIGENMKMTIKPGALVISNNLLGLFGYEGLMTPHKKTTKFLFTDEKKELNFESPIILSYLQPDYILSYCSIVQPSIIGGEYANILRIIPIPKDRSDYTIQEFKNQNFIPLLNTEISEIEINFRSHDGSLTNFSGNFNIIINLEFSNSM